MSENRNISYKLLKQRYCNRHNHAFRIFVSMLSIKIMKKLLFVLSIFSILLTSSCQRDQKKRYKIGVSQCSTDLWRQIANKEMLRELAFYPDMQIEIKSVEDNSEQQIVDIESFITEKVDVLIVSPNEGTALTPVIKKAYSAGIPVILLDRKIDTNDYTAYVGADNYQLGYEAGLYIAGILNSQGNVVEMRGWDKTTAEQERHKGFTDVLKKYPDINIIASPHGNFRTDQAEKEMDLLLKKEDRHIDLIFSMNDAMALGVSKAYEKYSGKRPYIVGVDALPGEKGGISYIEKNLIDASLIYPTGGDKVIEIANMIVNNKPVKKENILYTGVVDKSNVRMLQLQTNQIYEHQAKIDRINESLNKSIIQYSNQRTLFYISIIVIVLVTGLLLLSLSAYRAKSKANKQLEIQNDEIKRQAEILTEQKEQLMSLSKQLEEATNAKLVFFTNISHEFKTPLSLILGPVDTLLAENELKRNQRELLRLIKRNSNRLLNLISEIIEFRSFENGKMRMNFTEDNIRLFIENLNPLFYDYLKRKRINLLFEAEDTSFDMIFDKEKVEKIYFNIISNALKHANMEGTIKISLKKEEIEGQPFARLSVFNSGSYIPPELLSNIFDRFYRIDSPEEGTGIGLALTSTLVEAHHGKINVESVKGMGTTFIVTLPFKQAEKTDSQKKISYETGYIASQLEQETSDLPIDDLLSTNKVDETKSLILIVEDNADMRSFLHTILGTDYTVIEANDGKEGIVKARKYLPDLIISDVMMPEKDGFEVCKYLKENIMTSHIPVILLTACSLDEEKTIGFESGADAYIPKPFNAELLKIRVRKLIENRQKIKESFGSSLVSDTKKETIGDLEQVFLDRFKDYIEAHISNSELNVEDIAKDIGLSKSQLYRKIKALTNYSPNELIRIIRLKYAKHLLAANKSVADVAYEAGFSSPSYFTKCFKEFYNENPTNYINKINEK